MSNPLFDIKNLTFKYMLGSQRISALSGVNCQIKKGEMLLVMGPSGSGKSTLLNLIGLIEPLQEGDILFNSRDFRTLCELERNHIRRFEIGFIFQSFLLFDVLSVEENVEYFLIKQRVPHSIRKQKTKTVLERVGLADKVGCYPNELSFGQRQRVAIARALAKDPKIIIADEPTASLDQKTSEEILQILKDLASNGHTVILASHDPLAQSYCSRIIRLKDGSLIKEEISQ